MLLYCIVLVIGKKNISIINGYVPDEENNALFVGHTGVDAWFGMKGDTPFAARLVDEKEGIDNRVIFIDNINHDLSVVLDGENFVWIQVGYDCRPLEKKDV